MLFRSIAELETLLGKTQKELNDATLYARDPKKFASLSETLTKAQAELAAAEERWLELEILREEIAKPSS